MFSKIVSFAIFSVAFGDNHNCYELCRTAEYRCFGLPDKCVEQNNCDVVLTVRLVSSDSIEYELYWFISDPEDRYVSVGLSLDPRIADDGCSVCKLTDTGVKCYEALTTDYKLGERYLGNDIYYLTKISDRLLVAKWETSLDYTFSEMKVNKKFIMLIYGKVSSNVLLDNVLQLSNNS